MSSENETLSTHISMVTSEWNDPHQPSILQTSARLSSSSCMLGYTLSISALNVEEEIAVFINGRWVNRWSA